MFESLSDRFDSAFKNLKGQGELQNSISLPQLKIFAGHW